MKRVKLLKLIGAVCLLATITWGFYVPIKAAGLQEKTRIADGIFVDEIELSGMNVEEATGAVQAYMDSLSERILTFEAVNQNQIACTAEDLGIAWDNPEIITSAMELGKTGNIVKRYKELEDLKHGKYVYSLEFSFDATKILEILETQGTKYDVSPKDFSLRKTAEGFEVEQGQTGLSLNVEQSFLQVQEFLTTGWNREDATIALVVDVTNPRGSEEELLQVRDVLGSFTTSYATSGKDRSANVENGCRLINGITLYPGDEFSTLSTITPFTEANGYFPAGSYINGMVVDSLGGGICQVSTTLYNAVLLSELETTQRSSHSMIISYVEPSMDAAIAESSGKDFKFINNTAAPIYIEGVTNQKKITFTIYGVEYRPKNRKVRFESEILSTTQPDTEKIVQDASRPLGFIDVQSAHIGYKAQLWKIVEEDGVEVSRTTINKSTYKMSPRTATVGMQTGNAEHLDRVKSAIASGSINVVKAELAAIEAEKNLHEMQLQGANE